MVKYSHNSIHMRGITKLHLSVPLMWGTFTDRYIQTGWFGDTIAHQYSSHIGTLSIWMIFQTMSFCI